MAIDTISRALSGQASTAAKQAKETADSAMEQAIAAVPGAVSDWLEDNVTPTTPVVDASLSIAGAAADAKATGDGIADLKSAINGTDGLHAVEEPCVITSAGKWSAKTSGSHVCIPISGGDTITLVGGSIVSYYGFLTSNTISPGTSASFSSVSGYTSRISLSANTGSGIISAPSDAKYLYFPTVNNVGHDQIPTSVTINGVQIVYNIRRKIDDHDVSITKNSGLHGIINGTSGLADGGSPCVIRNNDGEWTIPTNGKHIRFPIKSGDVINITGGANATYYAILKSNENPQYGNYATFSTATGFTQRILLSAGANTGNFTAPADAVYLYIAVQNNAGQSQSPTSLTINGVEMAYNIRQKIDSLANNVTSEEGRSANKSALDIWGMRSSYDGVYTPVSFSGLSFLSGFTLPVFGDGYKFKHTVDLSQYKNTSSHTTTVTSQSALTTAITNATSGDTIILDSGRYTPITIGKSINLIGNGQVIFADQAPYEFTETATSGTWRTANNSVSTAPTAVLDITRIADGIIIPLTKVVDPTTVTQTKYGWCHVTATNNVYVQLDGTAVDGKNIVLCYNSTKIINCKSSSENAKVYLENITVVGGHTNIWVEDATGYTSQKLIAKNCRCYYAQQGNSIGLRGVDGYFQNCECAYARLDGFNYHINNTSENSGGDNTGTISNGLEVDCIGHDSGISDTGTNYSDNGSTAHDAAKVVRVNGVYYNNKGGNVADVTGVTSYNYGCYAFDSTAPNNTNRADFWCRDSSSNMYLYGCRSSGNSQYNLCAANSSTIHASKCEYTTTTGTIDVLA